LTDVVCFSHLRWQFVYQRPQHLMSRAARHGRVVFVEEPFESAGPPDLRTWTTDEGVVVCQPTLPRLAGDGWDDPFVRSSVDRMLRAQRVNRPVLWHYTPLSEPMSRGMAGAAVVYDCMDELTAFKDAPASLRTAERRLMERADLVFTGGQSLYEAKRHQHPSVHAFPSGVDADHFRRARAPQDLPVPDDMAAIQGPRLVYVGVIDERIDLDLVRELADARPDWSIVLIGPVVKIDESALPRRPNIHALGMRGYDELPAYLAQADVALMPFARNDATLYISPTKTPEYLAAGLPVVSTSIRDVVQPYGNLGLVAIADEPDAFVAACERVLTDRPRLGAVDAILRRLSWDATWERMSARIAEAVAGTAAKDPGPAGDRAAGSSS
jgi:glycosyltransferase involved in cell wall biosynthesis